MPRHTYRKVIVTEELLEQVNPVNKLLQDRFLKTKKITSSPGTVEGYRSDLNIYFVFTLLNNDNISFIDAKKHHLADFFYFCSEELKFSPARYGRMRSCLSSFSNWIEQKMDSEYPNFRNIVLKAVDSVPKNPVREKTILTDEQIDGLLNYLSKEINKPQEACLLALAVYSGSRASELLRFTTDIIDPNNTAFDGLFIETTKQIRTKGRGKSGKMLHKYIIKDLFMPYYENWIIERKKILDKNGLNHNHLFIKPDGKPAELGTLRSWIAKWEGFLGVPFYLHALRHHLTTKLSKIGFSYELITELFGWADLVMAKYYDDSTAKDKTWKDLEKLKVVLDK